jgi:hypothetical protein
MQCVCGLEFSTGKVCTVCQATYCEKENVTDSCSLCNSLALTSINEVTETLKGNRILWIKTPFMPRIGLIGIDKPPPGYFRIFDSPELKKASGAFDILLCKNKQETIKFVTNVSKEYARMIDNAVYNRPDERSRYNLVQADNGRVYLLLNCAVLNPVDVAFISEFMFEELSLAKQKWTQGDSILYSYVAKGLVSYNEKIGLKLLYRLASEHFEMLVKLIGDNLKSYFMEHHALYSVIRSDNITSAKTFLENRIDLSFSLVKWQDIDFLPEINKLVALYLHSKLLVSMLDKCQYYNNH